MDIPGMGIAFKHIDTQCLESFKTMNQAQTLYMNSMRVPLLGTSLQKTPSDISFDNTQSSTTSHSDPMQVNVRIDLKDGLMSHSLCIQSAPKSAKRFVFLSGAKPCFIPCSAWRSTNVAIECFHEGQKTDSQYVKSFLWDTNLQKKSELNPEATIAWSQDAHQFHTIIRVPGYETTLSFSCFQYQQDTEMTSTQETQISEYGMEHAWTDFSNVLQKPCFTPSSQQLILVSSEEAAKKVADIEVNVMNLEKTFDAIFTNTVQKELGAKEIQAQSMKNDVDWKKSYSCASDAQISQLIHNSKGLYTHCSFVSNMVVACDWLHDDTVQSLLRSRLNLANSVKGRRSCTEKVMDVRVAFLLISAIDDVLRSTCKVDVPYCADELFVSSASVLSNVSCYDYWLAQLHANTHNSIDLRPETYQQALCVLDECRALHKCGAVSRIPPICNVLKGALKPSSLCCKAWESMHLQGLAIQHALVVAPCPHFLYKNRACLNFEQHPIVQSLLTRVAHADGLQRQSLQTQLGAAALLTMLVSTDVEHRIIPRGLGTHILTLLQRVTAADAEETEKHEAFKFLMHVFDEQLHSLAAGALGCTDLIDLHFLSDAHNRPATTGYNMTEVTSFCLESSLKLQNL